MSDVKPDTIANLLIAEDDDSMRRFLEITLKRQNYSVSVAKDGAEALELALKSNFDVIITDAVMPNLSGYDLCRILRQTAEKKDIPLILLSGFDQTDGENEGANLADFYLRKGEDLKVRLFEILSNLIGAKM
jgi:DNA-binding response OmpR family regulator